MKKNRMTMRTIAATLAALSLMSVFSMTVRADELCDTAVETSEASAAPSQEEEITADTSESTDTAADETSAETAPEDTAETTDETAIPAADTAEIPEGTEESAPAEDTTAPESETAEETADTAAPESDTSTEETAAEETPTEETTAEAEPTSEDTAAEEPAEETAEMPMNTIPAADAATAATAEETADESEAQFYGIIFLTGCDINIRPVEGPAGTPVTVPEMPEREGYVFLGWDKDIPETIPEELLIVTAQWQCIAPEEDASAEQEFVAEADLDLYKEITLQKFGMDMGDAAFDTIAQVVPGSRVFLQPFKEIFHCAAEDDDSDPLKAMGKKLDNIDNNIKEVKQKLDDLNAKVDSNTQWLAEAMKTNTELSMIRGYYQSMSPDIVRLNKDIQAIETDPNLTKSKKMLRLAQLTDTPTYRNVSDNVFKIGCAMDKSNENVFGSMFDALYKSRAQNKLLSLEAYREASVIANDLTTQYVYAVLLMSECQAATQAVDRFEAANIEELGTGADLANYLHFKEFDAYRKTFDNEDCVRALICATNGYIDFKNKYENSHLINNGTVDRPFSVSIDGTKITKDMYSADKAKTNALIADYVRKNRKGSTIRSFLEENDVYVPHNYSGTPSWLIVDSNLRYEDKETDSFCCVVEREVTHRYRHYVKVVDIDDPLCTVQEIGVDESYEKKYYSWSFIYITSDTWGDRNFVHYIVDFKFR